MATKEIDLTGIDNVNEYYTNHYLNTLFAVQYQDADKRLERVG